MLSRTTLTPTAWLTACAIAILVATPPGARAADADARADPIATSSRCKAARQQAWFQRQLRMTDGDREPLLPAEPAACAPMAIAAEMPAKDHAAGSRGENAGEKRR